MGINPRDPRTPYRQVADAIRAQITSGALRPGAKLPSMRELTEEWDVSNPTIQRALKALKAEGLIEGTAGRGVYVREQLPMVCVSSSYIAPGPDGTWPTWQSEAAKHGMEGSQALTSVEEVTAPEDVAAKLELTENDQAIVRRRIMYLDGRPVQVADSYYPSSLAANTPLAEPARIRGGANSLLAELGHAPHECIEIVTAAMPSPEEADELQLAEGVPVIRIVRTSATTAGRPVEVLVMTLAADRHQLQYKLPLHG